jgi:hypothetical protein
MQTVGYTRDVAAHVEHRICSLDLCALGSALCALERTGRQLEHTLAVALWCLPARALPAPARLS